MGGYDIFYAVWNGTDFTGLTNMGYNYNSSADDMFLRFDKSGRTGYLVSNRPDKDKKKMKSIYCCDDIYSLVLRDLIIDLNALVVDTEDGMIDGATVELIDLTAGGEPTSKTNFTANNFNFLLDSDRKYKAVITHPDYYPDSTSFNTLGIIDDYSVKKTVKLKMKPKEPETEIVSINQPIRLNNIYYDFDDTKILSDAERDLNVLYDLMEEYPDMVIELSSHTDSRGTTPYNKDLSQRRANSAKEWLVREGIASERIQPVGYGESKLVNGCSNGVRCTEEEHQLNRRTEFKIIAGPQTIEIKREIFKGVKPADEEYQGSKNSLQDPKPIIKIENNNQDLGELKRGTKVPFEFKIENVGDADLIIEVVSTCKCTEIEWPTKAIKPGEKGVIRALYDTTFQHAGATEKIVDIIANTDPIVVEARFKAFIKE
jgi:peptidoglycan-associated lipoprotein